jgi:hypothetical protein
LFLGDTIRSTMPYLTSLGSGIIPERLQMEKCVTGRPAEGGKVAMALMIERALDSASGDGEADRRR